MSRYFLTILFSSLIACLLYGGHYYWDKNNQTISTLKTTGQELESKLAKTTSQLTKAMEENASFSDQIKTLSVELEAEKVKNERFEEQIEELAGTVNILDKIAKTDKELLQKYSKVYFLSENYVPSSLKQIREEYVLPGKKDQYFHGDAIRWLERMIRDAKRDDIELRVISAYRSFDEQDELKGQFTQIYGTGANAFSADQGYSEHQLGTAVDMTDPETGATSQSFAKTKAYKWLLENAYRYGFILSYPEGNQFYIFEPWHWRFVGRQLATDLHGDSAEFYDLDQRKIDEYLVTLFD